MVPIQSELLNAGRNDVSYRSSIVLLFLFQEGEVRGLAMWYLFSHVTVIVMEHRIIGEVFN